MKYDCGVIDFSRINLALLDEVAGPLNSSRVVYRRMIGELLGKAPARCTHEFQESSAQRIQMVENLAFWSCKPVFVIARLAASKMPHVIDMVRDSDMVKIRRKKKFARRNGRNEIPVVDDPAVKEVVGKGVSKASRSDPRRTERIKRGRLHRLLIEKPRSRGQSCERRAEAVTCIEYRPVLFLQFVQRRT